MRFVTFYCIFTQFKWRHCDVHLKGPDVLAYYLVSVLIYWTYIYNLVHDAGLSARLCQVQIVHSALPDFECCQKVC